MKSTGTGTRAPYRRRVKADSDTQRPPVAVITDIDALVATLLERLSASGLGSSPDEGEAYWTAEQAAAYIAADKQRIYDLRSQGRLRCVKDGARVLTRRSWLDAYLDGGS